MASMAVAVIATSSIKEIGEGAKRPADRPADYSPERPSNPTVEPSGSSFATDHDGQAVRHDQDDHGEAEHHCPETLLHVVSSHDSRFPKWKADRAYA